MPGVKPASAPTPELTTYAPVKGPDNKTTMLDLSTEPRRLIAETDVIAAAQAGHKLIRYGKDAILTPLARDAAAARGIELIELI